MSTQYPALIIMLPFFLALIVFAIGWFNKNYCYKLAVATLIGCFLLSIGIMKDVMANGTIHYWMAGWEPPWGIEYVVDYLSGFMLVVVSFISLLVVISSKKSVEKEMPGKDPAFYSLFLLLVTGLMGIVITGDVFNLFVFLEISAISCYALIAIGEDGAPLASFNYIVMGTIGAGFYLLGVGYLFISTGSLNMADLANLLPNLYHSKVILVGFAFLTVGVAVKAGLFPLHGWLPDAYCTAPSAVSALIAPLMTKVAAYVMIRVMFTVFQPHFSVEIVPVFLILGWLSVFAIFFGGIKALAQTDLKRMLVYIVVAEVGYIVIGVSAANRMGLTGAILHIMNDAIMMACLFLVVSAIFYKTGTRNIHDLRYMNKKMPFTMAAFTITALSMVGIPPACGFFSKWYLILGSIEAGQWVWAAALLCSSLINAVLFFRVIECAYFKPMAPAYAHDGGTHEEVQRDEAPLTMLVPIVITALGVILLGLFSGNIISSVIQFAVPASF